ncbi:MAG: hypothetical protein H8K05_06910 [Nitrospira sp.]|nr:hypothetical protein [Nitrospira sp.]
MWSDQDDRVTKSRPVTDQSGIASLLLHSPLPPVPQRPFRPFLACVSLQQILLSVDGGWSWQREFVTK